MYENREKVIILSLCNLNFDLFLLCLLRFWKCNIQHPVLIGGINLITFDLARQPNRPDKFSMSSLDKVVIFFLLLLFLFLLSFDSENVMGQGDINILWIHPRNFGFENDIILCLRDVETKGADFFASVVFEFPCPVTDFRHILAMPGDIFLMFYELVADHLFGVCSNIPKLQDAVDHVSHQMEAV